ncbi:NAD(P)-dependent oxidoreductase, partial [Paenibacillus macerans]|nr:NAD(P)-dependent oxidoreductase [Paenibacillus macerans]
MKALVTGATGFLGGHLARRLVREGWDVTGIGRNPEQGRRLEAEGIRFRNQDLRDESGTAAACTGQDAVFHCAALSSPWGKYRDFYGCNVEAARILAEASLREGVRRFIHVSTPSVYFDYVPRLGIRESEPLPVKGANHYAVTKRLAEQVVERYHAMGLPSVIIRPRAVFGPYDQALFPRIVAASGKSGVPLIGGGKALIDATYVDNAVDALLNA